MALHTLPLQKVLAKESGLKAKVVAAGPWEGRGCDKQGQGRRQQEVRLQSKLMELLWFERGKENEQRLFRGETMEGLQRIRPHDL